MNHTIRVAKKVDRHRIAALHSDGIRTGFLSLLGPRFLANLYLAISNDRDSIIFVSGKSNIDGFITGTVSTKVMYKKIIWKNWPSLLIPAAPFFIKASFMKRALETFFYGIELGRNQPKRTISRAEPELLSIAVDASARGKKIGQSLVAALEEWFKQRGLSHYKVVTYNRDTISNEFYKKCGFTYRRSFKHHENILNEYGKEI